MHQHALVTGSAGFIGSALAEVLSKKYEVTGIDNFSAGNAKPVQTIKADILLDDITHHFKGADVVFHFAANPSVLLGASDTSVHVEQNILATHKVLEAMRKNNVKKIVFASSSTVYGNAKKMPTPEDYSPLEPVSIYGASKLACEALISSYCHVFGMQAWILRLANIIGPKSNHGIILDFVKKLKANPGELEILGNGKQNKSYLYIDDCISAVLAGFEKSNEKIKHVQRRLKRSDKRYGNRKDYLWRNETRAKIQVHWRPRGLERRRARHDARYNPAQVPRMEAEIHEQRGREKDNS